MPRGLSISDFTYDLPDAQIARYPLPARDASRLLVYRDGDISETVFSQLAECLPANALLVFNETRVLPARLIYRKESGGVIEIFCLEPASAYAGISEAMAAAGSVRFRCMVGGAAKWKSGVLLSWEASGVVLSAEMLGKDGNDFLIHFSWDTPSLSFSEILSVFGHVPLPPYLNRADEPEDHERYQSVLAKNEGSVAAPTASLHFSAETLQTIADKGIQQATVTLHVGAGTFRPVKSELIDDHAMHAEWLEVSKTTIAQLLAQLENGPVVAVGTTVLRTLESLYWMGCKAAAHPEYSAQELSVSQWEPYETDYPELPASAALNSLLQFLATSTQEVLIARTGILIAPGYSFRLVDALVTNFHQPQSTLLLLVAAFIGEDWRRVYHVALGQKFRFLSYGDGSLLWRS